MQHDPPRILVLGVGNILYTDEGVGVRAVEKLQREHEFSDNVTLMDGGTLGMRLMDSIMQADKLIVVDAVHGGKEPGTLYRFTGEDLRKSLAFKDSMHQLDLVDTLIFCKELGNRPDTVVIGIEPYDLRTLAMEMSPAIIERLDSLTRLVLDEITACGGRFMPKPAPQP